MIFLFSIGISFKAHKITVKFIIYSIVSSILTIYFSEIFESLTTDFIWEANIILNSVIKLAGVFVALLAHLMSYELLARTIVIYYDSKSNKRNLCVSKFIEKTSNLESILRLFIYLIFSIIVSVLLTQCIVFK